MKKLSFIIAPMLLLTACSDDVIVKQNTPRPVVSINIETAQKDSKKFIGNIESQTSNALAFPLSGEIIEKYKDVSDVVKKDEVLAKLDPEDLLLQLATAKSNLDTLKAQFDASTRAVKRIENLFKEGFASSQNLEDAKRQNASLKSFMEQTEASINRAENLVTLTELQAPQDGVITQVNGEVGTFVSAGAPLFMMASTNSREAVFSLPIQETELIDQNTQFEVILTANESVKVKASLQKIEPVASQQTRSRKVRLKLMDPPESMRLGALVNVQILSEAQAFFKLPKSALLQDKDQYFVWVIDQDSRTLVKKQVTLNFEDKNVVHISNGLTAKDEILVKGVHSVKEGQIVGKQVSQ